MDFVVTLIAAGPDSGLSERLCGSLQALLVDAGARAGTPDWLAPGIACDLPFEGIEPRAAEARLRERLQGKAIDLLAQAAEGRRKGLLVADMESTIIGQEMLDELAGGLGLREPVAAITARAMAGELDFTAALRERVGLLKGLPATVLDQAAEQMTLNDGARELIATLRAQGVHTALVSGGFGCFAAPIATLCGFDQWSANELEIADSQLSGRVREPVLDREAKLHTLKRLAASLGLGLEATCALGDGANDAAMLSAAGLGVAYRGKPIARAAANACLDHANLTALLYFQGYRNDQIRR